MHDRRCFTLEVVVSGSSWAAPDNAVLSSAVRACVLDNCNIRLCDQGESPSLAAHSVLDRGCSDFCSLCTSAVATYSAHHTESDYFWFRHCNGVPRTPHCPTKAWLPPRLS